MKNLRIGILSWALSVHLISCDNKTSIENSTSWQMIETVEDLWSQQPDQIRSLFNTLDIQQVALKEIKEALFNGDTLGAAKGLLTYYNHVDHPWIVTTLDSIPLEEALYQANSLLKDSVVRQGKSYRIPINPDGGWKWDYTGPDEDDEFGYGLNGHKYMSSLYIAWKKTGSNKYIEAFDRLTRDWILHHPMPTKTDSVYQVWESQTRIDYRDIGEVEWRTLETGHRLGASWPQLFYGLQGEKRFQPATRLLLLSSLAKQANLLREHHKSGHNWTTMEMNGLALAGLSFPEFKQAENWANYALEVMKNEINRQVYPDGVQTEISSKTQWVALNRFETLASNFEKAQQEIPMDYQQRVEKMYDYLAYTMRPDGHQPLNNDSDRDDLKPRVLKAAKKFNRPDWKWIATNGEEGSAPKRNPSLTYPWAGIHIMRNGWNREADWSFFETGPYGTGHQHRDKLHLSITAFGKDLLVDGGRYTHKDYFNFDPSSWRGYFRSSYSHNVLLVDGNGQKAGPTKAGEPILEGKDYIHTKKYDYASGQFNYGYENVEGQAMHRRSVVYVKDQFWVVLDYFKTDRPRNIQALWHYAPDCQVKFEGLEAVSSNENEPNLRIVPIGDILWETEIIKGQEKPVKQGWYSAIFGEKVPNPTAIYSANIVKSTIFGWILTPSKGIVPKVSAKLSQNGEEVRLSLGRNNEDDLEITLPLERDISRVDVKFKGGSR